MTIIDVNPVQRIHYNGVINVSKLLNTIHGWFSAEKYNKVLEPVNKFKEATFGHDVEVEIVGEKKINEYIKYKIEVKIVLRDGESVEIIEGGEKKKGRQGGVVIEITSTLITDWQETMSKGKFSRFKHVVYSYILKPKLEDHWDTLYYKAIALQKTIKNTLNMSA